MKCFAQKRKEIADFEYSASESKRIQKIIDNVHKINLNSQDMKDILKLILQAKTMNETYMRNIIYILGEKLER